MVGCMYGVERVIVRVSGPAEPPMVFEILVYVFGMAYMVFLFIHLCMVHMVFWYAFGMVYMVCRFIWLEQCVLCFSWYIQKEFIWFVCMG